MTAHLHRVGDEGKVWGIAEVLTFYFTSYYIVIKLLLQDIGDGGGGEDGVGGKVNV